MGTRVQFWLGALDGLESIILDELPEFRKWYEKALKQYPEDHDPKTLKLVDEALRVGPTIFDVKSKDDAIQIDKLVEAFIGEYCDYGEGCKLLKEADGSMINVRHYYEHLKHLKEEKFVLSFWNFILNGRPLSRNSDIHPYNSEDGIFRVSYVTFEEIKKLKHDFEKLNLFESLQSAGLMSPIIAINNAYHAKTGMIITVA